LRQNCTWNLLPELDQETLKDIGVGAAGHRLRILKAIATLQTKQSSAPALDTDEPVEPRAERMAMR